MHSLIKFLCLALAIGLLSGTALADPPRASHDHWRNTNYPSHYMLYDQSTHTYVETVDCRVLWRFTLVSNQTNTLTLFDVSRGMTVRLDYSGMWLKPSGAADFSFYQNGTFDTRTLFEHSDANGVYTGSIIKRPACVWEEWFPGGGQPAFRFTQSAISNEAIDLFDASRNMTVRLDDGRMWLKQGNAAFGFFKNGRWRR